MTDTTTETTTEIENLQGYCIKRLESAIDEAVQHCWEDSDFDALRERWGTPDWTDVPGADIVYIPWENPPHRYYKEFKGERLFECANAMAGIADPEAFVKAAKEAGVK